MTGARLLVSLALLCLGSAAVVAAQEAAPATPTMPPTPQRFTGRLVDAGGSVARKQSEYFTLQVDSYSPPEEIQEYVAALAAGGQDAVIKRLSKAKSRGWVKVGTSLGCEVQVIRSIPTENGRVIRVVTDRPIQLAEVMRGLRSEDYPLGLVELRLDPEDNGEGTLIAAAAVKFSGTTVELESFGTVPFRLLKVKPETRGNE
jgi:hypothetical protein